MSLTSYIDAAYQEQTCQVKINGNTVKDILDIKISSSLQDTLTQCTIKVLNNPNTQPESKVQVWMGYSGNHQLMFTGNIDDVTYNEYDATYDIVARDVLKEAMDTYLVQEIKFGLDSQTGLIYYSIYNGSVFQEFEYSDFGSLYAAHPETQGNIINQGVKTEALIGWLLQMAGFSSGNIQTDTTNFFVGDINPAVFHVTSIYDACMQVANLIGWRLYADAAGTVHFKQRPRNASGYVQWSYTDKNTPYNILKISRTDTSSDVRNYVEINGYSGIKYIARGNSPYLGTTPYRGVLISDELIDTPGMAQFIGNRTLNDLNRLKTTLNIDVKGNPLLYVGCSISVQSRIISGTFLVETLQHSMSSQEFKTTITASVYPGDVAFQEPTADILAAFVPVMVAGLGDPKYIVEFDGSASYSNRGQITQWQWTWPNASTYTTSVPQAWYTFDSTQITGGASGIVSLRVFDSVGNTATTSSGITLDGLLQQTPLKYRHIYAALTTDGVGSTTGGLAWNSIAIPAVSVGASNFMGNGGYVPTGYAIFGTTDGRVVKTIDGALTYYPVLTSPGIFRDVSVAELDGTFALAAVNNGSSATLYKSYDAGETWSNISTFSLPILQCRFDYTDYTHILVVCSGLNDVFESFDNGAHWVNNRYNVSAHWNDAGAFTNYYAHTSGIIAISGNTPIPIAGTSSDHVAITIKTDDDLGIMSVDSSGQHWVYSGGSMITTQFNPTNTTQHMIRDGELPVVYYAVASGVGKSLDFNYTMSGLYTPGGVYGKKVAYGPLAEPVRGKFYLFTSSEIETAAQVQQGSYDNNQSNGRGVFTADPDFYHWHKIIDGHIVAFATQPGLIAVLNDTQSLSLIITASGIGASGITPVINFYTPASGYTIEGLYLSRINSNLYTIESVVQGGSVHRVTQTFSNPKTSTAHISTTFAEDVTVNDTVSYYGRVLGGATDEVFWEYRRLVTPPANSFKYYNVNLLDGTFTFWQGSSLAPIDQYIIQSFVHFPGFSTIALNTNDNFYYVVSGIAGVTQTSLQRNAILLDMIDTEAPQSPGFLAESQYRTFFDSAFNKTSVYYATTSGIFYATNYGLGAINQIYTSASGRYLKNMWISHDSFDIYDYITAWEYRPDQQSRVAASGVARELIVYSIDNGANWAEGPDLPPLAGGVKPVVVYVDDIKNSLTSF